MNRGTTQDFSSLAAGFAGRILLPSDADYEAARVTYVVKDARPAVIAEAASSQDVAAVIDFATTHGLELSVRSGGHSVAGFSSSDGGLLLDLARINNIEVLDKQSGLVRLGAGAQWGAVAAELGRHGLALSSGDTRTVAVGGLTLGGGIGWMVRKYGYTIDSLVGAEVVLANGSVVQASSAAHRDLFWAIRGGGGNFGVVTRFEFKAHPQGKIVQNTLIFSPENRPELLRGWRDLMRTAPEDLTSFMTLMPSFGDQMPAQVMVMSCYAQDNQEEAEKLWAALRRLGKVRSENTAVTPYADMLQEAHPPAGLKFAVKNLYAKTFSDGLVAGIAQACCKPDSPIVQLRMMRGAADRVDPQATALPHRGNELFLFAGFPMSPDVPADQETRHMAAWPKLAPYSTGMYSNFLTTNTSEDIASLYPPVTYRRLAEIKRQYDPQNIFHRNFNIKPTPPTPTAKKAKPSS